MSTPIILHAVIHCCFKRGWSSVDRLRTFLDDLRQAGPRTPADLRRFLMQVRGGNQPLAAALLKAMPARGTETCGPCTLWFRLADGVQGRTWLASGVEQEDLRGGSSTSIDPIVVVKQLHPDLVDTPEGLMRFERERQVLDAVRHPHVVQSLGHGVDQAGEPYLIMAYVDGGDLHTLLERTRRMPVSEALLMAAQAARGLRAIHAHGVVHRDIKPKNLLVTRRGRIKIADFGATRDEHQGPSRHSIVAGPILNPWYVPPEQADPNTPLDGRSDVYALGAVLYHAMTGVPPYEARSTVDLIRAHAVAPLPDARRHLPDLHAAVLRLLEASLQKQVAQRPDAATMERLTDEALGAYGINAAAALAEDTISQAIVLPEGGPVRPASTRVAITPRPEPTGHAGDWLVLRGGDRLVHLLARSEVVLGRLPAPPCDITVRLPDHPERAAREGRIGRQHLRLSCGPTAAQVTDLASQNGTLCDGTPLAANGPRALGPGARLTLGTVVDLQVASIPRREAPAPKDLLPAIGAVCGLEAALPLDGLVITRPVDRPDVSYALVLRRLVIGGPGADVAVPGARERIEVARYGQRWLHRRPSGPWEPLEAGQDLHLGPGLVLRTEPGTHDAF